MAIGWKAAFEFTGPLTETGLLAVIFLKRRYTPFRAFTFFVAAGIAISLAINVVYAFGSLALYRSVYFAGDLLFFGFQIWVIVELAHAVIRPAGRWVAGAQRRFVLYACLGAGVALFASLLVQPAHLHGTALFLFHVEILGDLLMTEAVISMLFASGSFGLGWTNHVMAIGQGMMVLALTTVGVESLGLYFPPSNMVYQAAYYVRGVIYLVTMAYWIVSLWREEPPRKPISPALRKYIVALQDQVQYDLSKVRD